MYECAIGMASCTSGSLFFRRACSRLRKKSKGFLNSSVSTLMSSNLTPLLGRGLGRGPGRGRGGVGWRRSPRFLDAPRIPNAS